MAAYLVVTITISDSEKFGMYAKGVAGLSEKFGGEYVVRGPVAEILEGDVDPGERVIVARFPDADAARAYIASAEYQAAANRRKDAAEVKMRLLND